MEGEERHSHQLSGHHLSRRRGKGGHALSFSPPSLLQILPLQGGEEGEGHELGPGETVRNLWSFRRGGGEKSRDIFASTTNWLPKLGRTLEEKRRKKKEKYVVRWQVGICTIGDLFYQFFPRSPSTRLVLIKSEN